MGNRERLRDDKAKGRDDESLEFLEEGLQIDEHALDEALIRQPDLFYRVSKLLTHAVSRRDALKQAISEEEARCDAQFRNDAAEEKEKLTEPEIKRMIVLDKEVKKLNNDFLAIGRTVGQLTALKEAYQSRSYVLKDMVALYVANYYTSNQDGGPSARSLKEHSADIGRRGMAEARRRRERRDDDD